MLIPTACHRCGKTWLASPVLDARPVCDACHGPVSVVPGECYRAEDRPLFEKIESAVIAARLSESASYRLWGVLSNASERWRRPESLLLPVIDAVPALQFLIDELAADRAQLARAVGMCLATITTQLRTSEEWRLSFGPVARVVPERRPE